MRTSDLRAGAVTAWELDRGELVGFAVWAWALAATSAIIGAAFAITVMFVVTGLVPAVAATIKRARDHREAVDFFTWLNSLDPEEEREQQPETD